MPPKTRVVAHPRKQTDQKREFELAFQGLRKMLRPYDKKLRVTKDAAAAYMSDSKSIQYLEKPVMFASITSKSYVSFHLFPVYMFPDLLNGMSLALKKRMQGKTCWNFKNAEQPLFAELARIVEASFQRFAELGERNLSREDALAFWGAAKNKKS